MLATAPLGCHRSEVTFQPDRFLSVREGLTEQQAESVRLSLFDLFGDPDEPRLPEELPQLAMLLDLERLEQAAGPVESHTPGVTHGLYRRHCARCHGVTGDGRGPTALYQAPYPRDFRRGVFKWKSTYRDAKPTAEDLHAVLERGVAGAAMPSFALLSNDERETLRQYAVYLSIRGEAERALVGFVADELPRGEPLELDEALRAELAEAWLAPIIDGWIAAPDRVIPAPRVPSPDAIARGRELYHSERAGCYKCHGQAGQGGVTPGVDQPPDYDVWNRDRLETRDKQLLANDLPVRISKPRELTRQTPHGGADFASLYRRVHQGVAGTPMPSTGGLSPDDRSELTDEEIAALAAYTQSLMSLPTADAPIAIASEATRR